MTIIHKEFAAVKRDGEYLIATTPSFDRANDRVFPLGGNLNNYYNNPVVMWGHNYFEPWAIIGRAEEISVTSDGIKFRPALRPAANDADPMAIISLLWEQDYVRTASIGFNPTDARPNERGGMDYTSWELLEISVVSIPMNQDALRLAFKSAGVADDRLLDFVRRAGRVLSRANEGKIRSAHEALGEVLAQMESDEEDADKGKDKGNSQDTALYAVLSGYFNAVKPKIVRN